MDGLSQALVVTAVGFMVAGFVTAAVKTTGARRRSWTLFACGGTLYLAAEVYFGLAAPAGVSLADLLWLGSFPFYFVALHVRNLESRQAAPRGEGWIESALVMGACALVLWEALDRTVLASADTPFDAAVAVAYPVGDLGVLWLVLRSIYRYDTGWDRERALLAGGLCLLVGADVVWAMAGMPAAEPLSDLLYIASAVVMGAAGFSAARGRASLARRSARGRPLTFELMPYVAGLIIAAVPLVQIARGDPNFALALTAVLLLVLVFARLAMAIRENRELRETAERAALTDGLTGLRNHSYFQERVVAEVERARRASEPLGLLLIDIDRFKQINDEAGHRAGDRALRLLGETLKTISRPGDVPCRIGGDEFAVILPGAGRGGTLAFADRLTAAAAAIESQPASGSKPASTLSLSVGAALFPIMRRTRPRWSIARTSPCIGPSATDGLRPRSMTRRSLRPPMRKRSWPPLDRRSATESSTSRPCSRQAESRC